MSETTQPQTAQPFPVRRLLHDIAHLAHVELFTPKP
jgi:hypothetical protein